MIYIAICDDNEKTVEILKKKVMEFLKKSNEFADITVYTQSENLQYDIQEIIVKIKLILFLWILKCLI